MLGAKAAPHPYRKLELVKSCGIFQVQITGENGEGRLLIPTHMAYIEFAAASYIILENKINLALKIPNLERYLAVVKSVSAMFNHETRSQLRYLRFLQGKEADEGILQELYQQVLSHKALSESYIAKYEVPHHPLHAKGYPSIG